MNKQRAQEIAASPVMANVTYNGVPIYIQNVTENNETARIYPLNEPNNETARIYPLNEPNNEQEIPLSNLIEH